VAPKAKAESLDPLNRPSGDHPGAYVLEMAIPLKAVAGAFEGLLHNLIVGQIASITLLISVAVIGLCAPRYLRGRYLEGEMQLARQVQSNLQPKMDSISPFVEFAASSIAADQVGGDFYDIFKEESGKIAIILGDVSGKGLHAALLVSVLHGAIRSSTALQHEFACDRINRMLCERTAGERFVTMFWGVFDHETRILGYVNAGHAAPMLIRQGQLEMEILNEGGPVLGVLPHTSYSAGTVMIEDDDTLILYSDGISEASNDRDQEFGEARIHEIASDKSDHRAAQVCARIMSQVNAFASAGSLTDDRTLLVVKFSQSQSALLDLASLESGISAAA
jgi:sigma-B regulation protein RsbU (phosphoserine phosphatase)